MANGEKKTGKQTADEAVAGNVPTETARVKPEATAVESTGSVGASPSVGEVEVAPAELVPDDTPGQTMIQPQSETAPVVVQPIPADVAAAAVTREAVANDAARAGPAATRGSAIGSAIGSGNNGRRSGVRRRSTEPTASNAGGPAGGSGEGGGGGTNGGNGEKSDPARDNGEGAPTVVVNPFTLARVNLSLEYLRQIETASLYVLGLAALGIVLIIFLYPIFGAESFETRHAVELLLTLAGTVIILALLTRNPSGVILVIGFLIIGALIVPTNDLIRFALIAAGSEQSYRELVGAPSRATFRESRLDRTKDIATQVYQALWSGNHVCILPGNSADRLIGQIQDILRREQEVQTFENVRQRGTMELLVALSEHSDPDELIYLHGQDERFLADLEFLRQEGLVTYVYDDLDTLKLLEAGRQLAGKIAESSAQEAATPTEIVDTQTDQVRHPVPSDVEQIELSSQGVFNRLYTNPGSDRWLGFVVPRTGYYEIRAEAQTAADPVLVLTNDQGLEIAYNDDSRESFNAVIVFSLEGGKSYHLILRDLSSLGGVTLLNIAPWQVPDAVVAGPEIVCRPVEVAPVPTPAPAPATADPGPAMESEDTPAASPPALDVDPPVEDEEPPAESEEPSPPSPPPPSPSP